MNFLKHNSKENKMQKKYTFSQNTLVRFPTREIKVGEVGIGGNNEIRIQSMTTTDTMNTTATVEESIRIIKAGGELVRITAPSANEAKNLFEIKSELHKRGFTNPLIADIHFTPNAAEIAAGIIEKVRINPGNYVDKKQIITNEYTSEEYQLEKEKIRLKFAPLVEICKKNKTAIRIGTNHGSLSDRIMSKFGDSPEGMVESALEFVNICCNLDFHEIVLSMKASNTRIMVAAYRLLCKRMLEENMNYPIHLGVTEAGDGIDGRIKSAVGIGALLEEGIGDTIRVSLTEPPEDEIPVAKDILSKYQSDYFKMVSFGKNEITSTKNPYDYSKRRTFSVANIGGENQTKVIADFREIGEITIKDFEEIGYFYNEQDDKWKLSEQAVDFLILDKLPTFNLPQNLQVISKKEISGRIPLVKLSEIDNSTIITPIIVEFNLNEIDDKNFEKISNDTNVILKINTEFGEGILSQKRFFEFIEEKKIMNPVIVARNYLHLDEEKRLIYASIDFGALLLDGYLDGIILEMNPKNFKKYKMNEIMFGILQASRVRITKTEYIACPSCGRTLFDLVEVTNKIRKVTGHLKGLKIGIMGCVVNGPGEMADADFGYVGSGFGKITLYRSREIVKKNISSSIAVEELVNLIKTDGKWIESD